MQTCPQSPSINLRPGWQLQGCCTVGSVSNAGQMSWPVTPKVEIPHWGVWPFCAVFSHAWLTNQAAAVVAVKVVCFNSSFSIIPTSMVSRPADRGTCFCGQVLKTSNKNLLNIHMFAKHGPPPVANFLTPQTVAVWFLVKFLPKKSCCWKNSTSCSFHRPSKEGSNITVDRFFHLRFHTGSMKNWYDVIATFEKIGFEKPPTHPLKAKDHCPISWTHSGWSSMGFWCP